MRQDQQKQVAAEAALDFIETGEIIGVGTGSTTNFFIDALVKVKSKVDGVVASSEASSERLRAIGLPVLDLNRTGDLSLYVDGADEATRHLQLIKGGGGALTREKIVASASRRFVCIIDQSKLSDHLGSFPLPVEVIPMAQSLVARKLISMGGQPELRTSFTSDNGNVILDVRGLDLTDPLRMEAEINLLAGVVDNGLFAVRRADVLLVGTDDGVDQLQV
ncbi:MAG: ribose-5-phosphate isomerase RpiA [Arenicellales bacterium]|jgi:ribose 5-phosphate isomerase A|nr:ribose-5-phosphate isomerase RpiA [Arenicellales bacterium]MDP7564220.1 ribose-5-phosphate isomerase RpiA [Arenicellales bacterium]MEE1558556.1 ribose-5-phosphate isomerase RpiA [Arenicellales bacterium]|tara:strand:- start:1110 stop:1769 length:660 start_codon:yes stop_codon:yes gene_type:complete